MTTEMKICENNVTENILCQKTMPFYDFMPNYDTLCVQAGMGIGKTNTLYDFLKYNLRIKYKSCLIISFRVSLCEKYLDDLNTFEIYSNVKSSITPDANPFMICQIDSIYRIRGEYDLIVLDEISYSLTHMVTSVKKRNLCNQFLEEILSSKNNKIIAMDALLNEDWINYLSKFNRKINYIKNTYSIHEDKIIVNFNNNNIDFYNKILKCIKNKENIVIASNSKNELRAIYNIIENNDRNISKHFIMKETKKKYDINTWNKYQVLAYSPSIVAGVSYTEKHFNRFFGIFCNTSATAELSIQQMFRIRDISTKEYNICTITTGKRDFPEDDKSIKKYIINEDKNLINGIDNIKLSFIRNKIEENHYFDLYMIVQKLKFKSCNNFNKQLVGLLKLQGINIFKEGARNFDETDKKSFNKIKRETRKFYEEQEAERIQNAKNVDTEEYEELSEKIDKTDDDIYALKKYKFKNNNKIPYEKVTKDNILKYKNHIKKLYNLSRVLLYRDEFIDKMIKRFELEEKKLNNESNCYRLGYDKTLEKIFMGVHMVKFFGFNDIFDKTSIKIDKNKFKEYIINYGHVLEILFRTNKFIEYDSYSKCKQFINSKLRSLFKISIVEDRKNKTQYIKGLDFWDDNGITYKNPLILQELKEKEENMYEQDKINDLILDIINGNDEVNNIGCRICGEKTIFDNEYCIKHKMELKLKN